MANNEVSMQTNVSGATVYSLLSNEAGQVYKAGGTREMYSSASRALYAIAASAEQGSSRRYILTLPSDLPSDTWSIDSFKQAGGAPADSDLLIWQKDCPLVWNGTEIVTTGAYLTSASLYKTFVQWPAGNTDLDAMLSLLVPQVDLAIRNELNRPVIEQRTGLVEILDGTGKEWLCLMHNPVQALIEIRENPQAGYGAATDAFGSDTILDPTQYALRLDDPLNPTWSRAGIVVRLNGQVWQNRVVRQRGMLANNWERSQGTIKITYTAGITADANPPADLSLCANLAISFVRLQAKTGLPLTSEGLAEYSYSLSQLTAAFLQTPTAMSILAKYRRSPFSGGYPS